MTMLVAPVWSIRLSLISAIVGTMLVLTGITMLQVLGSALVVAAVVLPIARLPLPSRHEMTTEASPIDQRSEAPSSAPRSTVWDSLTAAHAHATLLSTLGVADDVLEPLRARRITTVGDVLTLDPDMLLKLKGFDERKLLTLADALAQAGFLPQDVLHPQGEEARQTPENAAMLDQISKWLRESQGVGQARQGRRAQPDTS